jgi:molybdenum cofactor guanylyltransferase
MGTNKALLRLTNTGPTVIETVLARLRAAGFDNPLLVTNTPDEYRSLGLHSVPDEVPGAGALGGILTALLHSSSPHVLVVACDMPLLNPDLLRYMASLTFDSAALVPRWQDGPHTRVEPLHAVYTRECIQPLHERIDAGHLKVSAFTGSLDVQYIEGDELMRFDPQLLSFYNINTPEEWSALARISLREDEMTHQ